MAMNLSTVAGGNMVRLATNGCYPLETNTQTERAMAGRRAGAAVFDVSTLLIRLHEH